ncbi:Lrp/AsnC family transcriptional regulator [Amorphus coralli]|uniref:Lrp/AsnC family transcriptional regulator n=1 Tax=Amorphus coralli TaxID=340680 RepID=UPI00035F7E6E|nr:Lrp/AsnC family transcriptional regulator [Amorphus coralli]|tara:strand:+ start:3401 stop:3883 length:483 start_codon:yes stop_codon:yes gene_type:complete
MKRLRFENGPVDGVDLRLLALLVDNARITTASLAREVGLSAPSVGERLRRLEEAGIVTGYSATLDPAALGLPISAWLRVRPLPGELVRVAGIIQACESVVQCDRITGEDCFIAKVCVPSIADLEALIDTLIPYSTTNTSIIQSSPVPPRPPALPDTTRDG